MPVNVRVRDFHRSILRFTAKITALEDRRRSKKHRHPDALKKLATTGMLKWIPACGFLHARSFWAYD